MKVTVNKAAPDVYVLAFDDTEIALDAFELKDLLFQVTRFLIPDGEPAQSTEERSREFTRYIKRANDVGIQRFLRAADQGDLLVLLKSGENDQGLLDKFYGNMTERSRKMFTEDLVYKFREGVTSSQVNTALGRLIRTAKNLEEEGSLVFDNASAG